jgi:hypothetical protein
VAALNLSSRLGLFTHICTHMHTHNIHYTEGERERSNIKVNIYTHMVPNTTAHHVHTQYTYNTHINNQYVISVSHVTNSHTQTQTHTHTHTHSDTNRQSNNKHNKLAKVCHTHTQHRKSYICIHTHQAITIDISCK